MRFLLFNLIVAGALVYLLSDGGLSERVRQSLALVGDRLGTAPAAAPAAPTAVPAPRATATPAPAPRSEPLAEQAVAAAAADPADAPAAPVVEATAPPAPVASETAASTPTPVTPAATELVPTSDPAVQRRRAEVLGTAPAETAATTEGFMSPQLRRRELQVLSEEMELLFSQLIAR